jgi:Icc-related predicted phosphoesterase
MKFELDGFKVLEKDIGHLFGQPGRKAIEENRKHWIKTGFDVGEDHTIPIYPIFIDAYLFGGKIYLITTSGTSEKKAENELVRIIVLDKDSLQLKDQYKLMKENDETIICFCVGGNEDSPSFYVSMETEKGNIIAEYSVKNEI